MKKTKRILATAMAGFSLLTLVGCGGAKKSPNNTVPEQPNVESPADNSLQEQIDALQDALKEMQNQLSDAQKDIAELKETDKNLLALINTNMASLTESYNSLLKQINDLKENHEALSGDVSALQTQYSTLNTQLQSLTSNLSTLQSVLETLQQDNTTQTLVETIKALQSKINLLTVQNAMSYTLNTRYNSISGGDSAYAVRVNANPNGEWCGYSESYTSQSQYSYAISLDGFCFTNIDGEQKATQGYSYTDMFTHYIHASTGAEKSGSTYTLTGSELTNATVTLNDEGYVENFVGEQGAENRVSFSFTGIDSNLYKYEYDNYVGHVPIVSYYQTVSNAMDASFDLNYAKISGKMTANGGITGEAMVVVGKGKSAQYQTTTEGESTFTGYFVNEKGVSQQAYTAENGEITFDTWDESSDVSAKYMGKSLKQSLFSSEFTISFDQDANTYTISQEGKQSVTVTLKEDGKFTDFTAMAAEEYTGFPDQKVTYHIEGLDKAKFEEEFKAIKDKLEELIEQYNSNLNL